jgi:hypothetical protein
MCAGEKAAAAVMPMVQSSVWRGAIVVSSSFFNVSCLLLQRMVQLLQLIAFDER